MSVTASDDVAAEAPSEAFLETIANNVSPCEAKRLVRRRNRWEKRALLWRVSGLQRLRYCGRYPRASAGAVAVRLRAGIAGYSGLQTCGSVWACPTCSARILLGRGVEVGAVLGEAARQGYGLAFVTLTMRHGRSDGLRALWDAAGKAWRRTITGKVWDRTEGVVGWVRIWEVTYGRNGWHVHVHAALVLEPGTTGAELEEIAAPMFDRWSRGLVAAGQAAPRRVGQDWHLVYGADAGEELAAYLCKLVGQGDSEVAAAELGRELTRTMPGRARAGLATQPVAALLDEFTDTGDVELLNRWHEWEADSQGRKQVGWSTGLRRRFIPQLREKSDEELAAEEFGSSDDDLVLIELDGWRELVGRPRLLPELLERTEAGGLSALRGVLDEQGVPYLVVAREGQT